ncbi:Major Facilitator Superfamily protein [Micromonospora phaseoli]|uniref:Major Facilitator Superfamily protein n=1 Tax=Micromonospora phaseoli TaxID=1144548 RepID=A0A1H7CCQ1_9ACTN|nr:MFS transporter [Micromonospora phaseoli]PZV97925.1 MFS transporter [Micromonospora phaseoli]GIJ78592.1 MFS transporter [Micromonospora phaseoli]SEJ87246.1 Major Facilitator Superfamily protein [Micromonospora phaseoli]
MTTVDPTPTSLPAALAEPTVSVRRGWIALLFAANLGVWMAFFTPIQVLLPQQLGQIAPANKETMLAVVTGVGALAAVIANPLAGALSDRTCLRLGRWEFGRRHVWTLGGAVLGALALVLLAQARTVLAVTVGWVAAQVCFNAMLASLTAAVPDRVPVTQRGGVSGWVGIPQALGLVLGVVLVTAVVTGNAAGYLAMAAVVLLLALPFALRTADDPLPRTHRPPLRGLFRGMWVSPRRYPDFGWAWITRFLVQLGNALGTLYLLYFLTDEVRVADPEGGLLVLILLYTAGLMATTVVAGRLSDRTGRRKVFVIAAGVVIAVAALLLAVAPTWPMALIAALLLGGGYGVYLSVDAALITQVLPRATDRAKDLGVINIANSAPQVLGPAISAPIVVYLGGYPALYATTAAVTLLGSVLVLKIRSVP